MLSQGPRLLRRWVATLLTKYLENTAVEHQELLCLRETKNSLFAVRLATPFWFNLACEVLTKSNRMSVGLAMLSKHHEVSRSKPWTLIRANCLLRGQRPRSFCPPGTISEKGETMLSEDAKRNGLRETGCCWTRSCRCMGPPWMHRWILFHTCWCWHQHVLQTLQPGCPDKTINLLQYCVLTNVLDWFEFLFLNGDLTKCCCAIRSTARLLTNFWQHMGHKSTYKCSCSLLQRTSWLSALHLCRRWLHMSRTPTICGHK